MIGDTLPKRLLFSKQALARWAFPLIVILVGTAAFGLGRLSILESQKAQLKIYAPPQPAAAAAAAGTLAVPAPAPARPVSDPNAAKNFVASKNGTKYYAAECPGAARIKAENQVWFASAADAQKAGYTLAANCTGVPNQ